MHIDLDQGLVPNTPEAMDLARLDDEDVAGTGLELLTVYGPYAAAFSTISIRSAPSV
jgi:hypothetical protein